MKLKTSEDGKKLIASFGIFHLSKIEFDISSKEEEMKIRRHLILINRIVGITVISVAVIVVFFLLKTNS